MSFAKNVFNCGIIFVYVSFFCYVQSHVSKRLSKNEILEYRNRVKNMFEHGYNSYLKYAADYDELQPLSCRGMDTWGSFSLTLIDALDTLAIMGNNSEFRRIADIVINSFDFNQNINVSVFETNIRVVGGLLSAHLLSHKSGFRIGKGWPCEGPLLSLAENVARRLLPAFDTATGMPYGTVNLMYGVPNGETPITCTAGVGTFVIEFATLSRLTGDDVFEKKALNALRALHKTRSSIDLVGNHINTTDGRWTALDSGIGAGIDSYFEYLVKGSMLLQMPELMDMFEVYYKAINKYMRRDDWHLVVQMSSGLATMPIFQSLEAFWPGLLVLIGETSLAQKSLYNYHQVWKQFGFVPEFYDIPNYEVKRNGYPLRPEFIESLFYLYKATRDPHLLLIGVDVIESIEHSTRTECGFATVKDVKQHVIEDRMESFFLAETLKYLYLLFDETNFIHNDGSTGKEIKSSFGTCVIDSGGYVFNTEAHPIDIASVDCCFAHKDNDDKLFDEMTTNLDIYAFLDLNVNKRIKQENNSSDSDNSEKIMTDNSNHVNEQLNMESIDQKYVSVSADDLLTLQTSLPEPSKAEIVKEEFTISKTQELNTQTFSLFSEKSPNISELTAKSVIDDANVMTAVKVEAAQVTAHSATSANIIFDLSSIQKTLSNEPLFDFFFKILGDNSTITGNPNATDLKEVYELLRCPSTHFLQSFSLFGQVFVDN
ncbi:ER degradation-enhancing alpha-mannosidase-like protein 2 [Leptotrombidium deliense]|uniref:alpha-1,2-Mannosidase n=1 Tax=Leptotrombidium deliense TaxID=299467 RepID=A0A443SLJ3_9ACAR|nr:ER degradation-enhancing alpha-mannosidase-like protein 2 [Leptotrombidium deliense]